KRNGERLEHACVQSEGCRSREHVTAEVAIRSRRRVCEGRPVKPRGHQLVSWPVRGQTRIADEVRALVRRTAERVILASQNIQRLARAGCKQTVHLPTTGNPPDGRCR